MVIDRFNLGIFTPVQSVCRLGFSWMGSMVSLKGAKPVAGMEVIITFHRSSPSSYRSPAAEIKDRSAEESLLTADRRRG
jgi:hypothetical protein